jgi:S1-C subfamily serine protease
MVKRLKLISVLLLALLIGSLAIANSEETQYGTVGWWTIVYSEFSEFNLCSASVRFTESGTVLDLALMQSNSGKAWVIGISSPRWDKSLRKDYQYTLALVTNKKSWRGAFRVADDGRTLFFVDASIEFMNGIADASWLMILDDNRRPLLQSPLSMKDSADAIKGVVNCLHDHPFKAVPGSEAKTNTSIAGTGFFVAPNLLLTNNHVVRCTGAIQVRYPDSDWYKATISGQDPRNDLALLRTDMPNRSIATFHLQPRLGEQVATYGFPYAGILSSSGNFTLGNVTSLIGMGDDTRFLQTSTPVQPGNSGAPLVDMSGSVIGIVESQLSGLADDNSIPQNVNFAIQASIVINFLSIKGVNPKIDTSTERKLTPPDVADLAKQFTIQIYCDATSRKTSQTPAPKATVATEQQAKEFIVSLQAKWSRANAEALAGLEQIYEDEVMYFGKMKKKDEVIKEKQAFARRFPDRNYRPKEPITVSCSGGTCRVGGFVDFRSVDPAAKIVSKGVASFDYELRLSTGAMRISLENGGVLKREKTPLSSFSVNTDNNREH